MSTINSRRVISRKKSGFFPLLSASLNTELSLITAVSELMEIFTQIFIYTNIYTNVYTPGTTGKTKPRELGNYSLTKINR